MSETVGKYEEIMQSIEQQKEAHNALIQGYEDKKAAVEENMIQELSQIKNTEKLVEELDSLVDTNGKVKEGYEDRAKFIVNQLNEAYGTELEITDGVIGKYKEFKNSIYDVIKAKKAQTVLNSNEELYAESLKIQDTLYKDMADSIDTANKAHEEYDNKIIDTSNKIAELKEKLSKTGTFNIADKLKLESQIATLTTNLTKYKKCVDEADKFKEQTTTNYEKCTERIIAYDDLGVAMISENAEEIELAMRNVQTAYSETENVSGLTWKQQLEQAKINSEIMLNTCKKYGKDSIQEAQNRADLELAITAKSLTNSIKTVEDITPDKVEAYRYLGEQEYETYKAELEKLDPALRQQLQDQVGIIIEKTPEVERVTQELSDKIINTLDNSPEARQKAVETVKEYMNGLSDDEQRRLLELCGIENAEQVIAGLKRGELTEEVGINVLKGLWTGLKNNYWQGQTLSMAFGFAGKLLKGIKDKLGIKSPSKKTKQFGIYLLEGLGLGIKKEENSVLKTVGDFSNKVLDSFGLATNGISKGININPNDFKIDTNQFIDYGQISGAIATQSNVQVSSNLPQQVKEAVIEGMRNSKIKVEVEGKADKNAIFKVVQAGADEYYMQTGEPAFTY